MIKFLMYIKLLDYYRYYTYYYIRSGCCQQADHQGHVMVAGITGI